MISPVRANTSGSKPVYSAGASSPVAATHPEAGVQKPEMQNRPGQQLQPSVRGVHCWLFLMQHTPGEPAPFDGTHVHRESGHMPQLRPQPSSPHASDPATHFGVHGTHVPPSHFLPTGQSGHARGLPQLSVDGPHAPGSHASGVQ